MLYLKCPTCNELLGNRQIIIENAIESIINSDHDEDKKLEMKTELINNLGLTNHCCRMRVLTYVKLVDIIR